MYICLTWGVYMGDLEVILLYKLLFYVQEMSYLASRITEGEMGCMENLETWTEDVMSRSSFADLVKIFLYISIKPFTVAVLQRRP